MRACWFSDGDKLQYGDARVPAVGVTHRHEGPIALCSAGLHASVDVLDALRYAPASTLWLVECGGEIVKGDDKIVCTERTYIARADVDLRAFARWCALQVAHLWDCPPVVLQYLETGDSPLRAAAWAAARDAARAAARAAARDAAWDAARDAARAAARDAAWDAAWAAARAAAWAAARAAAMDAARAAQRTKLLQMASFEVIQ